MTFSRYLLLQNPPYYMLAGVLGTTPLQMIQRKQNLYNLFLQFEVT